MTVTLVQSDQDADKFEKWRWRHRFSTWVAIDTETTGLDPWGDRVRLVQFGDERDAYVLPYPERRRDVDDAMRFFAVYAPLVGQNTKFDAQFLANQGHDISALVDDTKIMGHLLDSGNTTSLKPMADRYLGAGASDSQAALKELMKAQYEVVDGKRKRVRDRWTWATIPTETYEYWYYAGQDTILTARLAAQLSRTVQERGYGTLYDLEVDVWQAMQRAEQRGMCVDVDYCIEQNAALRAQAQALQDQYPDVSLGGKKDLAALFEAAGIKLPRTAPTERFPRGQPKLTDEVLEGIDHPIADDVRKYRGLMKNASTYFEAFYNLEVDGRIHTTINPLGARTGRMSSERPNLQNVPKREAGSFVRRAFMASPDRTLVSADFKQIEYRIFASMCGEPEMIQAFLDGKDMHAVTAELALGHEPSEKERDMAKNGNFSELYLAGLKKFAATAGISLDAAQRFKDQYHSKFTRVKPFTRAVMKYAESNGLAVETTFGRRIPVDPEHIYAAVNYMIQGSAADVLKRAIQRIATTEWDEFFVLPVHDELIFDVPTERVPEFTKVLPELMEDHETYSVPLTIDIKTAARWGEQKEAA